MSKRQTFFESFVEHYGDDPDYLTEKRVLLINAEIRRRIDEIGISRAELARRLGVKQPEVSRLLNSDHNLTVRTVARLANALEAEWAAPKLVPKTVERHDEVEQREGCREGVSHGTYRVPAIELAA